MAKKKQDIDSLFRESLSDYALSAKKGNWELMNHLLNEQQRKRKNRKWFLLILLLAGILSSGLFVILSDNKIVNTMAKTDAVQSPDATGSDFPENKPNNTTKKSDAPNIVTPFPSASNLAKNEKDIIPEVILNKKGKRKDINNSIQQPIHLPKTTIPIEKNQAHNYSKDIEIQGKSFKTQTTTVLPSVDKTKITDALTPPVFPFVDSIVTMTGKVSISESIDSNQVGSKYTGFSKSNAVETLNQNLISSDSVSIKSFIADSIYEIANNNPIPDTIKALEPISAKSRALQLYAHAGLDIYNTSYSFKQQRNVAPLVGLELIHPFSSKLSIGLAGLYSRQGGYQLSDTAQAESFFLDRNTSTQTIQIHHLDKIYFPLTFYYSISKNHSFLWALQASYLLNTRGNYSELKRIEGRSTELHKNNVNGYMDGIKRSALAASLGYKYQLSERFNFGARITREFTRPYDQDAFYGVNNKPLWSLQALMTLKIY